MKRLIRAGIIFLVLLQVVSVMLAQNEDNQFCMKAFEDRNGNSQIDPGEPPLTRGVGANLLDIHGVIVQTALLDNSLTNAQGVICFTNLELGQYTMVITSAEYQATKRENLTVTITDDPQTHTTVFEYGGRRFDTQLNTSEDTAEESNELSDADIERIGIAAIGSMVAMVGAAFIGLFFYVILWRSRSRRSASSMMPSDAYYMRPGTDRRTTTGSMRAVQPRDTGEWRRGE